MAVQSQNAVLKLSASGTSQQQSYTLPPNQTVAIGRDPACQIALDAIWYKGVSRRHAELSPVTSANGQTQWQVRDLNSSNGIFINGQRLYGMQMLRSGDRLALGRNGVEFLFEMPSLQQTPKIGNQVNDTVYEYNSGSAPIPVPVPTSNSEKSNIGKFALGLAAIVIVFFVLNNSPSQQQAQGPSPSPSPTQPEDSPPDSSNPGRVEVQGIELFARYFKVIEEQVGEVPVKTSDGRDITIVAYVMAVEAKSTFNSSEVAFTVHFYDATGNEMGEPVPVVYQPSQAQWIQGTQGFAYFKLPPDPTNLKVIRFSR